MQTDSQTLRFFRSYGLVIVNEEKQSQQRRLKDEIASLRSQS